MKKIDRQLNIMMKNKKIYLSTGFMLLLLNPLIALSGIITYTDKSSFLAVIGSPNATMNYDGAVTDGQLINITSHIENGININNLGHIIDGTWSGGLYDIGSGAIAQTELNQTSTVTYTEDFFAAGFNLFTVKADGNHQGTIVSLNLSSGQTFSLDTAGLVNGESLFFGFVSDVALTSYSLTASTTTTGTGRRWLNTDNLLVSTNQIPEPTSLALLGLGLAGFGFSRTKKKA